jgi:hypothetical protein
MPPMISNTAHCFGAHPTISNCADGMRAADPIAPPDGRATMEAGEPANPDSGEARDNGWSPFEPTLNYDEPCRRRAAKILST